MLSCFKSSSQTRTVSSLRDEVLANRFRASKITNVSQSDETIRTSKIEELLPKLESTCETLTIQIELREKQITKRKKSYICGCLKKYMNKKTQRKIAAITKLQENAKESFDAINQLKSNGTAPQVLPSRIPGRQLNPAPFPDVVTPPAPSPVVVTPPAPSPDVVTPPAIEEEPAISIEDNIRINEAHLRQPNMCGDFCLKFLKDYFYPNTAVSMLDPDKYIHNNALDFHWGMANKLNIREKNLYSFTKGGNREYFIQWLNTLDKSIPYILREGPLYSPHAGHYLTMYYKDEQWCCVSNRSTVLPLTFEDGTITQEAIDLFNLESDQWSNNDVPAESFRDNLALFSYPMTEENYQHLSNYSYIVRTQGETSANVQYPLCFFNTLEKFVKGTPEKFLFDLGSYLNYQLELKVPAPEAYSLDIVRAVECLFDHQICHHTSSKELMENINSLNPEKVYLLTFPNDEDSSQNYGMFYYNENQWYYMDPMFNTIIVNESALNQPPFSEMSVLTQFRIGLVEENTLLMLTQYINLARQLGHSLALSTIFDLQESSSQTLSSPNTTPVFNTAESFGNFDNVCSERSIVYIAKRYGFSAPNFIPENYRDSNRQNDTQIDLMAPLSLIGVHSTFYYDGNAVEKLTAFIAELDKSLCYIMRTGANGMPGHHFCLNYSSAHQAWYIFDSPSLPSNKIFDNDRLTDYAIDRFTVSHGAWGKRHGEYLISATPIPKDEDIIHNLARYINAYRSTGSEAEADQMWAAINNIRAVPTNFES